jgi:choloylglycine hydrolase
MIIEMINGKFNVYHDKKYTVMTNQPTYPEQLKNLKQYKGLGGTKPLPGSHEPADRFVRGAFYLKNLSKPQSQRDAIAALMSVMRNTAAPFGLSSPERPNVSTTIWRTVADLSNQILFYDSVMSPQVFWVEMKKLNFKEGAPVMRLLVVDNYDLSKEVSGQFKKNEMFQFFPETRNKTFGKVKL